MVNSPEILQDSEKVVLAYVPETENYVTWAKSPTGGFVWGHYFGKDSEKAEADFKERVKRGY